MKSIFSLENRFVWDGSNITKTLKDCDKYIFSVYVEGKAINYIQIQKENQKFYCRLKKTSIVGAYTACVLDECKPIFNLHKIGTHFIRVDGDYYILYRINYNKRSNKIEREFSLNEVLEKLENGGKYLLRNEIFVSNIRKIFVFREIMGISSSNEKGIILRRINENIYIPMSSNEVSFSPEKERKVIPNYILQKWFNDIDMREILNQIFYIEEGENISILVQRIRTSIEECFKRVYPNSLFKVSHIVRRLTNRLF